MPAFLVAGSLGGTNFEASAHNGTHSRPSAPHSTNTERHPYLGARAATTNGAEMDPKLVPAASIAPPTASRSGLRYLARTEPGAALPPDSPRPKPRRQAISPRKLLVKPVIAPDTDHTTMARDAPRAQSDTVDEKSRQRRRDRGNQKEHREHAAVLGVAQSEFLPQRWRDRRQQLAVEHVQRREQYENADRQP